MTTITLLDGGMGKELKRIGAPFRQPQWSALALMESPEHVVEAHTNFIEAGAEIIITNNYAVVPFHLSEEVMAARGDELTTLAGKLARDAADNADRTVLVAGSLPPLFGSYEPDQFDPERAPEFYEAMVRALEPYVDFWIAETMSSVEELHAIANALATTGSTKALWASFALPDRWPDGTVAVHSAQTVDDIVGAISAHDERVEAVLFNCSLPEQIGPALRELVDAMSAAGLDQRTGGYANGFPDAPVEGYRANGVIFERRDDLNADGYAGIVAEWIDIGATIIGGCCDMYPDDIAELHRRFL